MRISLDVGNIGDVPAGDFWVGIFYADQMGGEETLRGLGVDEVVMVEGASPSSPTSMTPVVHRLAQPGDREEGDQ